MMRAAFGLSAAILAALCCACVLQGAVPPPPATAKSACTGDVFGPNVQLLTLPFEPSNNLGTAPTGTNPSSTPSWRMIQSDLQAAFDMTPQSVKQKLCGLAGVFITTENRSWGYRNTSDQSKYVALSMSLWSGGSARPFNEHLTDDLLDSVMLWPRGASWPKPMYLPATPNNLTVVAQLLHELGHTLLPELLVPTPGRPDRPDLMGFCSDKFFKRSWNPVSAFPRWQGVTVLGTDLPLPVADQAGDNPNDNPPSGSNPAGSDITILKTRQELGNGRTPQASRILARLYSPRRSWPSARAALSPVEDFVETFELYVLMNLRHDSANDPRLRSLPLSVLVQNKNSTAARELIRDIPNTLNARQKLLDKLSCFSSMFPPD